MKQTILILVIVELSIAAASIVSAQSNSEVVPKKWQPDLTAAIDWSASDLKDATAQMQMNSLSRNIAEMKDAQLFVIYVRLYQRLDSREREQLFAEQTKWLQARTKAAQKGIESEGGSLAGLESNTAEAEFTDKRIQELRGRLVAIEKKQR